MGSCSKPQAPPGSWPLGFSFSNTRRCCSGLAWSADEDLHCLGLGTCRGATTLPCRWPRMRLTRRPCSQSREVSDAKFEAAVADTRGIASTVRADGSDDGD